jgi:hypothetical protein
LFGAAMSVSRTFFGADGCRKIRQFLWGFAYFEVGRIRFSPESAANWHFVESDARIASRLRLISVVTVV